MLDRIKEWARVIKRDVLALWIAARDPRTRWYVKATAGAAAAYALSPIDLIPDIIPILGLLDEALLLPIAIALIVRMIPPELMREFRSAAAAHPRPVSKAGMTAVIMIWALAAGCLIWWLWPLWEGWLGSARWMPTPAI
ncbi:DUF1232 domain-containing protein [Mangrovicella endophytica]|uniref:DUF1232 domain-containing protein n=1 Tax=Mangrovicella endophytica TaxID=2066697 RepID=UPI000C9DE843|nr:DUF1232 domain-containing protein [Mangrovicella endophytica]